MGTFKEAVTTCLTHILDNEADDYAQWCIDEGRDFEHYSTNTEHVYASAVIAMEGDLK